MLSKIELKKLCAKSGLSLYQQEKDYLLKLFLFFYYRRFRSAVFKGGTCLKYLIGLDRFSEDLDFNLRSSPAMFKTQVEIVMKNIGSIGIDAKLRKQEIFPYSYACTIGFEGPLFADKHFSRNSFRIDAGKRGGTVLKPEWQLIKSEYPETGPAFLVLVMDKSEILAEKVSALFSREKGRDLYDLWFLLKSGITPDKTLIEKKLTAAKAKMKYVGIVTKRDYENDMSRLTNHAIPDYGQAITDVKESLRKSGMEE